MSKYVLCSASIVQSSKQLQIWLTISIGVQCLKQPSAMCIHLPQLKIVKDIDTHSCEPVTMSNKYNLHINVSAKQFKSIHPSIEQKCMQMTDHVKKKTLDNYKSQHEVMETNNQYQPLTIHVMFYKSSEIAPTSVVPVKLRNICIPSSYNDLRFSSIFLWTKA